MRCRCCDREIKYPSKNNNNPDGYEDLCGVCLKESSQYGKVVYFQHEGIRDGMNTKTNKSYD